MAAVSNEVVVGNPLQPMHGKIVSDIAGLFIGARHLRMFTAPALKELFEFHGFKCEMLTGYGIYPFPSIFTRVCKSPRYSLFITIKARKVA